MPEWLLDRPSIIALAIVGGTFSILASWCRSRGILSKRKVVWLNRAAYAFMTASIGLFIVAGLFGAAG